MEKGYVTEIFSSFQGEGPLVGRRQIFIRFAGCPFRCFYCDFSESRERVSKALFFIKGKCMEERNPISSQLVVEQVKKLLTPDIHTVSYTGGEPLMQPNFVREIAKRVKKMKLRSFIETNGYDAEAFASLCDYFDYTSIDIKLQEHRAVEDRDYEKVYFNEMECIKNSVDKRLETVVKVVVTKNTEIREIEEICADIADLPVNFVIQPVTPYNTEAVLPSVSHLFLLSEAAGSFLRQRVMVIPQVHKFMRIR